MSSRFDFLLPVMLLTVGGAFLILWRCGFRSASPWAVGFLSSAIGFTVPVWPKFVPTIVCGLAADTIFALAFFAYGRGLIGEADRGLVLNVRIGAFAAAVLLAVLTVPMGDLRIETTAADLCCAILLGASLVAMIGRLHDPARRTLFAVASLVELETVLRGSTAFLTARPVGDAGFLGTEYAFLMQAGAGMLGLLFALAALVTVLFDAMTGYRKDALVDPLSGLLNRRGFDEASAAMAASGRRGGAVIACDIDHFKRINDRHGHPTGDAVIARFAEMIQHALPAHAIARRSGGEEFTIFLSDANGADATRIANTIRRDFAGADWSRHGIDDGLTASFGVALAACDEPSLEPAIARADQALYDAKRGGRDRVCYQLQLVASNADAADRESACVAMA